MIRYYFLIALLGISSVMTAQEYSQEIEILRDRILAPVWVNGEGPATFIVDTCIRMPALSEHLVAERGLPRESVVHQGTAIPVVQTVLDYAGLPAHQIPATITECSGLSAMLGKEIHGLLPLYVPGYEVALDFRRHRITWRPLGAGLLQPDDPDAVRMRVDADGAPLVQLLLHGRSMRPFRVDTAFPQMLGLSEKDLQAIPGEAPARLHLDRAGEQGVDYFRLPRMQLGPARWNQPLGVVLPAGDAPRLGMRALKPFQVVMNYEAGLMRFDAASMTVHAPAVAGYGLVPVKLDRGLWEVAVLSGSPAARAGIAGGSRILRINGEPAERIPYAVLYRQLHATPGHEIRITLEAAPQQHHVLTSTALWE